jgi:uncharacterized protein (DUF3084 family)
MNKLKQQIQSEASQLALSLYNINLEKERIEKRMSELAVALNTVDAIEKQKLSEEDDGSV